MPIFECKAILFDMDGTLVDSAQCVERIWGSWAERHGLALHSILAVSHGRRAIDVLPEIAPHLDAAHEAHLLDAEELQARDGINAIRGAPGVLGGLGPEHWAVVTSAPRALAEFRLRCAGLPIPSTMVCAEDVVQGKPHPAGYLLGASLLGFAPEDCLAIEDTPAGIRAGRAAGMQVLAVATTFPAEKLSEAAAAIPDFQHLQVLRTPGALKVEVWDEALTPEPFD